ncbi:MAG TPA: N,N-dimethylformamidase beta subunit family domain-containing protein [Ktedonobacteraceae bacterium]|nr:N,N-dimethylformamidase beta subunit family domain-containing protein [Ktedonobacteraceae bacterium]
MKHRMAKVLKLHVRLMLISIVVITMIAIVSSHNPAQGFSVAPATAHADSLNPIQIENENPGTPGWNDFSSVLQDDAISGYGSKISVNHGDSLDFFVTTTAPSFTIDIFRTGYYGGVGARKITSLGSFPGLHQAIPTPDPVTGIIACNWTKATTLSIPSNWVTGVYLAKLTTSTGNSSFIFFVVRNDGGNEDIEFQTSVTTYQAYNSWGGTSLYTNLTNKSVYPYAHATKVSFDRPFSPGDSNGAGHYFFYEYKFVYWAESQGYNLTYTTDVDTDTNANPLTNHKAFLSVGHDEYWSKGMRDNVQSAINAGVNVAFFSANAMYWQIRFEPNAAGNPDRVEVGYKDFATDPSSGAGPDPMWNVNNAIVTTNWRAAPVNLPENGLIGVMYEDQVNQSYPFVVKNSTNWVYAGTGFVDGSSIPGIVGYEYDKVWNNGATPPGLTTLSNSPVVGAQVGSSVSNATLYTASSGARVFAGGTIQWSWGLANIQSNTYANAGIQQMTANILNSFITGVIPSVNISPLNVSFGNQNVGTTSAAQTIRLFNSGTSALSISSIGLTGTNGGDFAQTNNCPGSLAANASCNVSVTFTPTNSGSRTANLTFADGGPGSPQNVALSGNGTTTIPVVSLSPTSVSFGNQNVGTTSATAAVKLTNTGTVPLTISSIAVTGTNAGDFAQTNNCPGSLAANASCTITTTFTPTATGSRSANVTFTDNAADSPENEALSGTGTSPGSGTYFNDGFEGGNFSKWTLQNSDSTGTASVETSVVNSGAYAASLTNTSGQYVYLYTALPGGAQSQTFTRFYFRFSSLASGTMLALARNANGGNVWEMDYDGNRHGLDVYFWNSSGNTFSVFSAQNVFSANTWYSIEVQDSEITSGHGEVWLNGTSIGVVNTDLSTTLPYARLMLFDSAAGTMYIDDVKVADSYNGQVSPAPAVSLNPGSLSFGNQVVGTTSAPQTVTLKNSGNAPLNISNIALSGTNAGDFAQTNNCPSTLNNGASCTISVTFTPGATGTKSASVTFTDNAPDSPQNLALSGTGSVLAPAVSLSPTSLSFGNQNVGTTSTAKTITLTNSGTSALTISNIGLAGTNSGDFAQTNNCPGTLAANANCTISITFTPAANGSRSASLTLTDNAADSPQHAALTGTGTTAGVYFSDGFESGDFSNWNVSSGNTGQATVQTAVVNSGTYAAAFTNSNGQFVAISAPLNSGAQTQTYTRFYFRFTSSFTGTTPIAMAQDVNSTNMWLMYYDAGRHGLDVYFWNGARTRYDLYSNTNLLSPDTWYNIEVQDNEVTTGHGEVWVNGTSIGNFDGDLSATNPYYKLALYSESAGTAYFDDVKVSNSFNGTNGLKKQYPKPVKPVQPKGVHRKRKT